MSGFSSSTISALALDSTGAISVPTDSDLALGSGLQLNGIALDKAGANIFVTEENTGVYPVEITATGNTITMTAGTLVPSGTTGCAYVVNDPTSDTIFTADDSSVSAFTYTGSGVLTLSNTQQAGGPSQWLYGPPGGMAIDPQGKYLYVTSNGDEGTWQVPLSGSTLGAPGNEAWSYSTVNGPNCCVLDSTNSNLVVGNDDGSIEIFSLAGGLAQDSTNQITGSTASGANVMGIAFDPTGSFLATANGQSNDVTLFTYDGTQGSANVVTTVSVANSGPLNVIFNPSVKVVYAANTSSQPATISAYSYGPSSLTPLSGSPFATSTAVGGPSGMAIK